jgi:hypothetical protein
MATTHRVFFFSFLFFLGLFAILYGLCPLRCGTYPRWYIKDGVLASFLQNTLPPPPLRLPTTNHPTPIPNTDIHTHPFSHKHTHTLSLSLSLSLSLPLSLSLSLSQHTLILSHTRKYTQTRTNQLCLLPSLRYISTSRPPHTIRLLCLFYPYSHSNPHSSLNTTLHIPHTRLTTRNRQRQAK